MRSAENMEQAADIPNFKRANGMPELRLLSL
jgi:hypothetical protein